MIKLCHSYPDNTGSVIATITQESVDKMPEIALYLYLCGYRHIVLRPMAKIGRGMTNCIKAPSPKLYVKGLFDTLDSVITPIYHEKGDLIMTGTPEGVGEIVEGDVLEAELNGLCSLKVDVKH